MDEIITIRISKELKASLQKLADKDKRKLSDYIRLQLEAIVEHSKRNK
jgi:predicted transcriptional regulator